MNNENKIDNIAADPGTSARAGLEEVQQQAAEYLAGWQRATADYQNLQKQVAAERGLLMKYAHEELLLELLPALDHARQALTQAPTLDGANAQWVQGMRHIFDGLWTVLKSQGLEMMSDTMGAVFDPARHESVGVRKEGGKAVGVILHEQRPGYLLYGRVVRPAQVIISE